jgi:dihydroorotate dehydrogenase/NAD-dependent dihydropyrimidine dehydrogenase PreA subunit
MRHVLRSSNGNIISTSVSKSEYLSFDQGAKLIKEIKSRTDILVVASIACSSPDKIKTKEVDKISESKPDFFELNLKPVSDSILYKAFLQEDSLFYEERLANAVETACSLILELRKSLSVPLIVKNTVELADPTITNRFKLKGAEAVTVCNSLKIIEPELCLKQSRNLFMAALSGKSLKPLTFRSVALNFSFGKLPIVASGGLRNAQDVYYAMALGANSAELVTALLMEQFDWKKEIEKLGELVKNNGFNNISEIRGCLASSVLKQKIIEDHIFEIDQSVCSHCGQCEFLCEYQAVQKDCANYRIIPDSCVGCGLCVTGCNSDAIKEAPVIGYTR